MSRLFALALIAASLAACSKRNVQTRVFLHGDTVGEDEKPVPFTVVRLGSRETVSDEHGKFGFLYLEDCMRLGAGTAGVSNDEVRAFADGFEPFSVGFQLASVELVGFSSCPKQTNKYLRLRLRSRAR
jgi:hypothetical protein